MNADIKVSCRTNLDKFGDLGWPESLPGVPSIGQRIRAKHESPKGYSVELEICRATWEFVKYSAGREYWQLELELTMPQYSAKDINEFYKIHGF